MAGSFFVPLCSMPLAHLLTTKDLTDQGLQALLKESNTIVPHLGHRHDLTYTLPGRNIALVFFEPSTRTRLSFETAAHRLGASTALFQPAGSSIEKGETFLDTIQTIDAMKFDALVIRHGLDGTQAQIASTVSVQVISAGEGTKAHPTQGLLDASTLVEHYGTLEGMKLVIVGDVRHSRVARSQVDVCTRLGAEVAICAPSELLPQEHDFTHGLQTFHHVDEALEWCSVVSVLRLQRERFTDVDIHDLDAYRQRFSLTRERLERYPEMRMIHPGPVHPGVEIDHGLIQHPQSLIHRQVTHGVAMRMAVISRLLTQPSSIVSINKS